ESPDVFLAKATLQQYLSRIVRHDWDGVKRLTHPKARLAPWTSPNDELRIFEFREARSAGPGAVLLEVGEDVYHPDSQDMTTGGPAVYLLFKSRGTWLVGDRKPGLWLREMSDNSVRNRYAGWADSQAVTQAEVQAQVQAQARRESRIPRKRR